MEKTIRILMADDDADDRYFAKEAFEENKLANQLNFVEDGEELVKYLLHQDNYTPENAPKPDIILLDINMPKKSGIQALREIKQHENLKNIPIIMLTTSNSDEDICNCYELGANSYITKPVTFDGLVDVLKSLSNYWFKIVVLPRRE